MSYSNVLNKLTSSLLYDLGQTVQIFDRRRATSLLNLAWEYGRNPFAAIYCAETIRLTTSPKAAIEQIYDWIDIEPDALLAAYAGMLALEAHDFHEARRMLDLSRLFGEDEVGLSDLLETMLSERKDGPIMAQELIDELEDRCDLRSARRNAFGFIF